jgi:hypothetical protein
MNVLLNRKKPQSILRRQKGENSLGREGENPAKRKPGSRPRDSRAKTPYSSWSRSTGFFRAASQQGIAQAKLETAKAKANKISTTHIE